MAEKKGKKAAPKKTAAKKTTKKTAPKKKDVQGPTPGGRPVVMKTGSW